MKNLFLVFSLLSLIACNPQGEEFSSVYSDISENRDATSNVSRSLEDVEEDLAETNETVENLQVSYNISSEEINENNAFLENTKEDLEQTKADLESAKSGELSFC